MPPLSGGIKPYRSASFAATAKPDAPPIAAKPVVISFLLVIIIVLPASHRSSCFACGVGIHSYTPSRYERRKTEPEDLLQKNDSCARTVDRRKHSRSPELRTLRLETSPGPSRSSTEREQKRHRDRSGAAK